MCSFIAKYSRFRNHFHDVLFQNKTSSVRKVWPNFDAFSHPLLQWKSNKYYILWVCVCSLRYRACIAHAPYCHLWPIRLYSILPRYLINSSIFEKKKLFVVKYVLKFSVQLSCETFLFLRRTDIIINVYWFSCKVPVIIVRLWWKFNFLDRFSKIFEHGI